MTTVEYTPESVKALSKLDRKTAVRIKDYIGEVGKLADPRSRGKGLTSNLSGLWRYRVGDYRIISRITETKAEDEPPQTVITVLVVHIGHRSEIYR